MRIYLAANYSRHPEMREIRNRLEALGHSVTSRWIDGNHELTDIKNDPEYQRFANEDWQDLKRAELVLWFSAEPGSEKRGRGGRHVEFGIALAWGIPIRVIGRKENVFHWMAPVRHFDSLEAAGFPSSVGIASSTK